MAVKQFPRMWDAAAQLAAGATVPELAAQYGVPVKALQQRLNRAGFSNSGRVLGRSYLNTMIRPLIASDTGSVHYVQGRDHVPLPTGPVRHRRRLRPTGLDWTALAAVA